MTARSAAAVNLDAVGHTVELWPTAARALGIGRSKAYELARTGEWPTPVLRLGTRYRVPTAPLRELLGLTAIGTTRE